MREDEAAVVGVVEERTDVEQPERALTVELSRHAVETHVEPTRRESTRDNFGALRSLPLLRKSSHAHLISVQARPRPTPYECVLGYIASFLRVASEHTKDE